MMKVKTKVKIENMTDFIKDFSYDYELCFNLIKDIQDRINKNSNIDIICSSSYKNDGEAHFRLLKVDYDDYNDNYNVYYNFEIIT